MFKNINDEIKWLQKRIESNPHSILFARLAERYLQMDEYDRAIETCQAGLDEHPNYANAHLVLAKCYMKKSDFELADQEFRKLLTIQANHLVAHKLYGDLMTHTGWANSAETSYEKVLEIDPLETHMKEPLSNFVFEVQRSAEPGVNIEPVGETEIDYENDTADELFGVAEEEVGQDDGSLFSGGEKKSELTQLDPQVAQDIQDTDTDEYDLADETVEALFGKDEQETEDSFPFAQDEQETAGPLPFTQDEQETEGPLPFAQDEQETEGPLPFAQDEQELFIEGPAQTAPTMSQSDPDSDNLFGGAIATLPDQEEGPELEIDQPSVDDIFGDQTQDDDFIQNVEQNFEQPQIDQPVAEAEGPVSDGQETEGPEFPVADDFSVQESGTEAGADDDIFSADQDIGDDWTSSLEPDQDVASEESLAPQVASGSAQDDKDKYSDILEGIFSQDIDNEEQREAETRDKLEQVISEAEETTELDESYNFDEMDNQKIDASFLGVDSESSDADEASPEDLILQNADDAEIVPEQHSLDQEADIPEGYVAFEESDEDIFNAGSVHVDETVQDEENLDEDEEEFSDFLAGLGDPKEFNDVSDEEQEDQDNPFTTDVESEEDLDLDGPMQQFISQPETHDGPKEAEADQAADDQDESEDKTKEKFVTPTLGEIYAAQGQYAKAIHVFEMLLEKSPDNEFYLSKLEYLRKKLSESE